MARSAHVGFVRWIFKATLALVLALLIVVAGCIVVIALPVWVSAFAYGRQALLGAPGHGGGLAMLSMVFTLPIVIVFSIGLLPCLTVVLYRRVNWPKRLTDIGTDRDG